MGSAQNNKIVHKMSGMKFFCLLICNHNREVRSHDKNTSLYFYRGKSARHFSNLPSWQTSKEKWMDWITGIQKAIDYAEDHLEEKIDFEKVAE